MTTCFCAECGNSWNNGPTRDLSFTQICPPCKEKVRKALEGSTPLTIDYISLLGPTPFQGAANLAKSLKEISAKFPVVFTLQRQRGGDSQAPANHCPMDPQLNECQIAADLRTRNAELEEVTTGNRLLVLQDRDRCRKSLEKLRDWRDLPAAEIDATITSALETRCSRTTK